MRIRCRKLLLLAMLAGLLALALPVRHDADPVPTPGKNVAEIDSQATEETPVLQYVAPESADRPTPSRRDAVRLDRRRTAIDPRRYRYTQLECRQGPTGALCRRLERRGVRVVGLLPPERLVAAVPPGFRATDIPELVGEHAVVAKAKLTPRTAERVARAADDESVLVFAEFYNGVPGDMAAHLVAEAGLDVLPRGGLPEHVLLTRGTPAAIGRLASTNALSQIMQAPQKFAEDDRDILCLSDPQTVLDDGTVVPLYETVSNGWDGVGQGSAALRYYFGQMTDDLDEVDTEDELIRAMNTWAAHADITWTEVYSPNLSDCIEFDWLSSFDAGYDFDGSGGTLAHAYYPSPPNPETIAGDIEFDDEDLWEIGNPGAGMDVYSVALHELGHALGLGHSDDVNAVMYRYIWPNTVYPGLHADDIAGIQSIYAAPPAGAVTKWESVGSHDAVGDVAVMLTDGGTEPRASGLRTIQVTFDVTIDPASLSNGALELSGVTSGVVDTSAAIASLDGSGHVMIFTLASPLPTGDRFTITVASSVLGTDGHAVEAGQRVTVGTLVGDVDGSGTVGSGDIAAARQQGGAVTGVASARGDIDGSGVVTGVDLLSIHGRTGQSLP